MLPSVLPPPLYGYRCRFSCVEFSSKQARHQQWEDMGAVDVVPLFMFHQLGVKDPAPLRKYY